MLCLVFVQLCPSHQLGDLHCVNATGPAACEIKYKFGHFSVTQFGSPTAKIPLESGSSADKRFRTDLNFFLIRTVLYTSHKPMYKVNDDGFMRSRVDLESTLFFVSSPSSRKSSTNQKFAPISCAGNISNIRVRAHGP